VLDVVINRLSSSIQRRPRSFASPTRAPPRTAGSPARTMRRKRSSPMVLTNASFEPSGDRITSSRSGRRPYTSSGVREASAFALDAAAIKANNPATAPRCNRVRICWVVFKPSFPGCLFLNRTAGAKPAPAIPRLRSSAPAAVIVKGYSRIAGCDPRSSPHPAIRSAAPGRHCRSTSPRPDRSRRPGRR
jgi:hypothetical protein